MAELLLSFFHLLPVCPAGHYHCRHMLQIWALLTFLHTHGCNSCFSKYGLAWFVLVYCISILMLRPVKGKTYRLSQVWRLPPSWLMLTCSSWGFKAKMLTTLAQCYHGITRTSGWSVGVWDTRACAGKLKKKTHFSTSCALMHAPASADVQQPGHWLWHKRILFDVWLPHPECIRSLMASIDGQQREAITHVMDL